MKAITEKNDKDIINQWFDDAEKQTLETLPEFMNHLLNDYEHDYGTIVRAISASALAAAHAANHSKQGGITMFQSSFVMWNFLRYWSFKNNKCGLKIVDYDNMLYSGCECKFEKTISKSIMDNLQKEASVRLQDKENMYPDEVAHLESIAKGIPPFGYKITDL